ncbi:MAG: UPF0489 family protein [archaeon]
MNIDEYIRPPGTYYDILPHPNDDNRSMEVAIVQDHRFAFFYWLKWIKGQYGLPTPPSLISLDWHRDLAAPGTIECEWLKKLDTTNFKEVAFFCWDKLNCLNDGHILAAAYLNIIGDIYVVQKQELPSTERFKDIEGRIHTINCYRSVEALTEAISKIECLSVFFDIDLDYFTKSPDSCGGGERVELVSETDIRINLAPNGGLLSWIFPRIYGMTIATEPEFCGGLGNSNNLLTLVNDTLFEPPLLSHRADWRH